MAFFGYRNKKSSTWFKEKVLWYVELAMGTGLEHWKDLFADLHRDSFGYWSLIINMGQ